MQFRYSNAMIASSAKRRAWSGEPNVNGRLSPGSSGGWVIGKTSESTVTPVGVW